LCLFGLSTASTSLLLPLEQKDLRTDHVLNFLKPLSMADIMPNPAEKRMACAARLDRRFNFPGGVPESLTKLDTAILTPKKRKLGEEQEYKPEKLYKVLRQAWPRFQRDLEKAMIPAFMRRAGTLLEMGSVGRFDGRNNMTVFTRAGARRTVHGYWMIATSVGRNSVLAGLHAGNQRLEALGIVMVEANDDTLRHSQVPYASNAAIVAMVSFPCVLGDGWRVSQLLLVPSFHVLVGTTLTYCVTGSCMLFLSWFFLLRVPAVHFHAQQGRISALHLQGRQRG